MRVQTPVALLRSLSGKYPWERYESPYPPSYGLNSTTNVLPTLIFSSASMLLPVSVLLLESTFCLHITSQAKWCYWRDLHIGSCPALLWAHLFFIVVITFHTDLIFYFSKRFLHPYLCTYLPSVQSRGNFFYFLDFITSYHYTLLWYNANQRTISKCSDQYFKSKIILVWKFKL